MRYKPCLEPLAKASKGVIKHFDLDGWEFNSYSELIKRKTIAPEVQSLSKVNSSLIFVGNFTEDNLKRTDGFVAQLISFMFNNNFLYHFGRVKTLIWMRSPGWYHLMANPGQVDRKKMTVMRELTCDARVIAKTEKLKPVGRGTRILSGMVEPVPENEEEVISLDKEDLIPEVFVFETN
jgi:hypothetical protein